MKKKEGIRQLFNDIAPRYDLFNHLSSFNADKMWRNTAVKSIVDTNNSLNILDVATGTADFAIAIAQKTAKNSKIIGIDLADGMLEVGKQKIKGMPIKLEVGDAENLKYENETFDRVSVAFGVRNFENLPKGLAEMCRVLKKGGKLVILELSYPDNHFLIGCYKIYAFKIIPILGSQLSGNKGAYEYLPDSILKFPKPNTFIPMLKQAGFSNVTHKSFTFGTCRMYVAEK
ncbi:MAG: bifunctional demethylmenaquinone methyltransferase/2-methoxy-6-polyprenyl-1,4-benzoquinol methylase UbiE [Prevotellaceae bacterium]|nr:bifunctional demethylmenaquinone methyltransferase/2-methoxy-6-polyprenyl-1,4-benzoquinol methylase UbiE [Candidatus Faecinaster equi]